MKRLCSMHCRTVWYGLVVFLGACAVVRPSLIHAQQQDSCTIRWDSTIRITQFPWNSSIPRILAIGDTVHLGWKGHGDYYTVSSDNGFTWAEPYLVVPDSESAVDFKLAAAANVAYWAWTGCDTCVPIDPFRIYLRRKPGVSASWGSRTTITSGIIDLDFIGKDSNVYVSSVGILDTVIRFSRSSNFGETWQTQPTQFYPFSLVRMAATRDVVHAVRELPGPFGNGEIGYLRSTDRGLTWSTEEVLSTNEGITSQLPVVVADDSGMVYVAWNDGKYGGNFSGTILLRHSDDNGKTWFPEQIISQLATAVFPDIAVDGNTVAVTWDNDIGTPTPVSVRLSRDNSRTWCPIVNVGTPGIAGGNPTIAVTDRRLHVAWVNNDSDTMAQIFYRRSQPLPTSVGDIVSLPRPFTLQQNFPNPFNGETTVSFALPNPSHVVLCVYNVLGQRVAQLVNETKSAGAYSVRVSASELSSGVYIYRLITDFGTLQRKLIVLR